jgi:hypothetical protein
MEVADDEGVVYFLDGTSDLGFGGRIGSGGLR